MGFTTQRGPTPTTSAGGSGAVPESRERGHPEAARGLPRLRHRDLAARGHNVQVFTALYATRGQRWTGAGSGGAAAGCSRTPRAALELLRRRRSFDVVIDIQKRTGLGPAVLAGPPCSTWCTTSTMAPRSRSAASAFELVGWSPARAASVPVGLARSSCRTRRSSTHQPRWTATTSMWYRGRDPLVGSESVHRPGRDRASSCWAVSCRTVERDLGVTVLRRRRAPVLSVMATAIAAAPSWRATPPPSARRRRCGSWASSTRTSTACWPHRGSTSCGREGGGRRGASPSGRRSGHHRVDHRRTTGLLSRGRSRETMSELLTEPG